MRRNKRIDVRHFDPNPDHPLFSQLEPLLEGSEVTIDKYPITFIIENIYTDTDVYDEVISCIRQSKVEFVEFERREYTKKEMDTANFYDVKLDYTWEHDDNDAHKNGTLYDNRNKCPHCGLGECQITDLIIDTKKMGKRQIVYNYPDVIITEHTKRVIEENHLTGCDYRNVIDRKGKHEQNLFQLIPGQVIGPMDISRMALSKHHYCEYCTRGAVLRSEIVYPNSGLLQLQIN